MGDRIILSLASDDRDVLRTFDHVIAGTGFRIDVDRITYLDAALRAKMARLSGSPRLDRHFSNSLDGFYVVGPASANSFGPLFRFVIGAEHSARAIARHIGLTR